MSRELSWPQAVLFALGILLWVAALFMGDY